MPLPHYPAHESLQDYAARHRLPIRDAYAAWSARPYPAIGDEPAMGAGLGLRPSDVAAIVRSAPGAS